MQSQLNRPACQGTQCRAAGDPGLPPAASRGRAAARMRVRVVRLRFTPSKWHLPPGGAQAIAGLRWGLRQFSNKNQAMPQAGAASNWKECDEQHRSSRGCPATRPAGGPAGGGRARHRGLALGADLAGPGAGGHRCVDRDPGPAGDPAGAGLFPGRAAVGDQRLRAGVRRVPAARRAAGRPAGPAGDPDRRGRPVHRRVAGLRAGQLGRVAGRGPRGRRAWARR